LNRYPIQLAKVQPPPLRDETLARDRLLDWLAAKIHDRVVLVLADAGYGKTTLLADFSRRTRLRTLWYRLEEDDRDWIAFLNHLVAAGREHDPSFAPTTSSMLADMSVGGPTRDSAIDVFLRELPSIAEHGAILVLDDFHLVDESADVRLIARELVARMPERMSVVFASRRPPTIPLARLRAAGEVAELGTDDLRFDATETRRLFTESYGRTLEPDVLADVVARTEGWAASLQLVQAALRDRTPAEIRRFVRGLSGADKELYDYLAEEVVGDLPDDLQQFLMRTSILQTVSADLAAVVVDIEATEVARLTAAAERLTLLTRPTRSSQGPQRYHPLVREFLEARLRLTIGESEVADLHRRAAAAAASIDWRVAAHHYREAGDVELVGSVVAAAIPEIMGSGQYVVAAEYMEPIPPNLRPAGLSLVESRLAMQEGTYELAIALSKTVLSNALPGSQESDHALLNLATMHLHIGENERALDFVGRLVGSSRNSRLKLIADGMKLLVAAGSQGSIHAFSRQLLAMAEQQREVSPHYFGVSMLNLAIVAIAQDDPRIAIDYADQAIEALGQTSSRVETSSALMARATALTMLGNDLEAMAAIQEASGFGQVEAVLERADLADTYSGPDDALALLDEVDGIPDINANDRFALTLQAAMYHARRGNHDRAESRLAEIDPTSGVLVIAQRTARLVTRAYVSIAGDSPDGPELAALAEKAAKNQRADHWRRIAYVLQGFCASKEQFSAALAATSASPWNVTFVADLVARRLDELDERALATVAEAAAMHPGRWRFVLRDRIANAGPGEGLAGARLLETIGERSDIKRLRAYARRQRRYGGASSLGRILARRLGDRVFIEDQNRVSIRIGGRQVSGSSIRRKVLALICFLMTKPDLASTRDQVLEALWPDLDPIDAVNSLNQTVYFLRRILEEDYVEDLSPGYLNHDSDLIWFDRDLVTSRSNECRRLIKSLPPTPTPDQVLELATDYVGRFALDFEYEEWAAPYRDWLHASFLEVVERAVISDMSSGHFERGITLARRVLDIDPTAEQVEVSLLRLYRASGAHAAAAEQYGHYALMMRDQLGLEPPPLDAL
jgi:LuxR family maltose regulon positive regulatory protein